MNRFLLILLTLLTTVNFGAHANPKAKTEPAKIDGYAPLTRETLSKLYWKMDQMDITSDYDIDNFMLLNKCNIYEENYTDDFKWHDIREKARASILKNKKNFPQSFYIVQNIYLGRYNVETNMFPLMEPLKTSRFEIVATDAENFECNKHVSGNSVHRYPHKAIMTLAKPVELKSIQTPVDKATEYSFIYPLQNEKQIYRPAYLIMKFKAFEAAPIGTEQRRKSAALISAVLEEVEVYMDKGLQKPLYKEIVRQKSASSKEEKNVTPESDPAAHQ